VLVALDLAAPVRPPFAGPVGPPLAELDWEASLRELALLAETAGAMVVGTLVQRRRQPDATFFLGRGKVQEVRQLAAGQGADLVIADSDLSPGQQRNLERELALPVIDRTGLILDIFAQHARSNEGKIQVELAQLSYNLPRLTGRGVALSRLGGGIGTRGPGETKLEVDRRRIRRRITVLNRQVAQISRTRSQQRRARTLSQVPTAGLVGYTNAGKSTLLNALSGAQVLVEDKLFATLDPTTRRVALPDGLAVLVSDTVGFIRRLPHSLVHAFRATLEEVLAADLLLHVIDASHPEAREQHEAAQQVLGELGALDKPTITIFNKLDLVGAREEVAQWAARHRPSVLISAATGEGLGELRAVLTRLAASQLVLVEVMIPFGREELRALAHERGRVLAEEFTEQGCRLRVELPVEVANRLQQLLVPAGTAA